LKKSNRKKNRLNRLIFKKNRPVRFGFGFINKKPKKPNRTEPKPTKNRKKPSQTGKTEPNQKNRAKPKKPSQNQKKPRKPSQNRKNWVKPVWTGFCPKKPNRTETGRFDPVSVRFRFFFKKKISVWLLFFIKTEPNQKWSP